MPSRGLFAVALDLQLNSYLYLRLCLDLCLDLVAANDSNSVHL